MINRYFVKLLTMLVVVMIPSSLSLMAADEVYYPFLKLDMSNRNLESQTEPGFNSFTIADSGAEIDGITIELAATGTELAAGGVLDARWRGAPIDIPYSLIYRDFIFARPGGMMVTLSGLDANQTYQITIYAYDTGSAGNRIADWTGNGDFVLTTSFSGGSDPTSESSHAFSGIAQSDDNGTIVLECFPNENTVEQSGAGDPYAFVNGLVISSSTPITKSRRPVPEDGAIVPTTEVELQWMPGMTSVSSNIYFGEDFDDVNEATTDSDLFRGNTTDTSFTVGSPGNPYPEGLSVKTTYYWRTDEVEEDGTTYKGDVWSFTVASSTAFNPKPLDGSMYIDPNVILSWIPGAGSIEHHVYFGDNLQDVQAGTADTDKGVVTDPNYNPPGFLEREKTYYWRIDEFDGTDTHTGELWSFTTTLEGLGTVVLEMWEDIAGNTLNLLLEDPRYPDNPTSTEELTEFSTADSIGDNYGARIHGWLYVPLTGEYTFWFSSADEGELWLSTNDDPANVQLLASEPVWGWYDSFSHKSDPVSLISGDKYYIMAIWKEGADWDHCQVAWNGAGIPEQEIIQGSFLSPFEPLSAYGPNPISGSIDVEINTVLSWKPGKHAASHIVYFGTDPNVLNQVATKALGDESYVPSSPLEFNQTYHWRVDEVNDVHPDSPWIGKIWNFTTGNFLVIEDFEDYNDYEPDTVWNTWLDGYDDPTNGSSAGYPDPDFFADEHYLEDEIVNGGNWSMPLFYDNSSAMISEVTRTLNADWAEHGFVTLTLWHYGDPNNAPEPMYVALNGDVVVTNDDANAALITEWTQWDIPLQLFVDQGVNLANVNTLSIGFGNKASPTLGGTGFVFFDDIRLYRLALKQ